MSPLETEMILFNLYYVVTKYLNLCTSTHFIVNIVFWLPGKLPPYNPVTLSLSQLWIQKEDLRFASMFEEWPVVQYIKTMLLMPLWYDEMEGRVGSGICLGGCVSV